MRHDTNSEEGTETEKTTVKAANAGMKTFATPGEEVRLVLEALPPGVESDADHGTVGLSIRSDAIEGRLFLEPEKAEQLGRLLMDTGYTARNIEE